MESGKIFVLPRKNFKIEKENGQFVFKKATEETTNCPSIDIMMISLASFFGEHMAGVLLSGIGDDGVAGICDIKNYKGYVVVQKDPHFNVMIEKVKEEGCFLESLSPKEIAKRLTSLFQ